MASVEYRNLAPRSDVRPMLARYIVSTISQFFKRACVHMSVCTSLVPMSTPYACSSHRECALARRTTWKFVLVLLLLGTFDVAVAHDPKALLSQYGHTAWRVRMARCRVLRVPSHRRRMAISRWDERRSVSFRRRQVRTAITRQWRATDISGNRFAAGDTRRQPLDRHDRRSCPLVAQSPD
jgi:hypothetical protein